MSRAPITELLFRRAAGDPAADAALAPLVYAELRALAARQMRRERSGHTLTPTALVNEMWLRLASDPGQSSGNRVQFLAHAARGMRQVLVDHARRRDASKRGGGNAALSLSGIEAAAEAPGVDALALEQALKALEAMDPRKARVVELRYFAGLEMGEIGELLGISRMTAHRDWDVARAFLRVQLES